MSQFVLTTSSQLASFSSQPVPQAANLRSYLAQLSRSTHLTADPKTQRLGSGGGTVNALHHAWTESNKTPNPVRTLSQWIDQQQRLVLHAGGESRRLPAYAAVGKAFIPMPREARVQPQLPQPKLADYQLPQMQQALNGAGSKASVMVASGDVWLDFEPAEIASVDTDITGIGMRVSAEVAQHFGVHFVPKSQDNSASGHTRPISFFLQKPSPAEIRHFEAKYDFYVDTGMWLFSADAVQFLFKRCGWSDTSQRFTTKTGLPLPLDLYTEIGCALGTETKPSPALKKLGLHKLSASVIPLEAAHFYHLGSSRQILESIEEMQRHSPSVQRFFCIAASANSFTSTSRAAVWIEASQAATPIRLGGHNLLTGLPAQARITHLSPNTCVDVVAVAETAYVFRPYHIDDSYRGLPGAGGTICGRDAAEWLAARGFPVEKQDVFDLPLYPLVPASDISQAWLDWFFADQPDLEISLQLKNLSRISARQISEQINFERYFTQRSTGYAEQFKADFQRLIDQGDTSVLEQDCAALAAFCRNEAPQLASWLRKNRSAIAAAVRKPELQARFTLLLSELVEGEARAALTREGFAQLQTAMVTSRQLAKMIPQRSLKEDQIVWGRSPVRLDLAGGWTDTPPFCLQAGGSVLNVAVLLNGQPPIQVFVRPTTDTCLQLRSIDLGSSETVNTYDELADFRNPRGHFSLPKAALAMAGFLPEFFAGKPHRTLRSQLKSLGGGLEISLLSAVPKGSGLGTSSILAATILGALNRACGLGWDDLDLYNRVLGVEQLLTTGGGWQDQAGALFPGLKFIETQPGATQQPSIRYLPTQLVGPDILNRQLLLYYTGATRMAKGILQEIVRDMFLGRAETLRTLEAIRANARHLYQDLHGGDTHAVQRAIARSWELNKQLDSGTTTPEIERIIATCGDDLGACKLLGAGGGGYMLICAKNSESGSRIREKLEASPPNPRARFIDFAISPTGLQVTVS
nr:bifunctional fucokinase/fucose-1-phosphate guanylyltransferase [Nibricoccus aquaticus]